MGDTNNPYEQEREARIARNKTMLEELQVQDTSRSIMASVAALEARKKKARSVPAPSDTAPIRHSSRSAAAAARRRMHDAAAAVESEDSEEADEADGSRKRKGQQDDYDPEDDEEQEDSDDSAEEVSEPEEGRPKPRTPRGNGQGRRGQRFAVMKKGGKRKLKPAREEGGDLAIARAMAAAPSKANHREVLFSGGKSSERRQNATRASMDLPPSRSQDVVQLSDSTGSAAAQDGTPDYDDDLKRAIALSLLDAAPSSMGGGANNSSNRAASGVSPAAGGRQRTVSRGGERGPYGGGECEEDISVRKTKGKGKQPIFSGEEWELVFKHISKGRETITAHDLMRVSEELGHPGGDEVDNDMASMLLRRAAELTGSGASHMRMHQLVKLGELMYA